VLRKGERHIEPLAAGSLILEPVKKALAAELLEPLREPSLYDFVVDLPPESVGELEKRFGRLERELSPECDDTCYGWIIRRDGTPAGLLQATCNNDRQAFIGYEVFRPFRRQGVAKAAVNAVIGFLARATDTQQVIAYVDTRNEASIGLLLSLGFSQLRLIQGADWFKGSVSDELEFGRDLPGRF
jgi:RimJ/RimL family protein N-acetyltransferase